MSVQQEPAWKDFERVVIKVLTHHGLHVRFHSPQGDSGYDLDADFGGERWAIEVKFYRTERAQMKLLESAAVRVSNNGHAAHVDRGVLVVSSFIPPEQRLALENRFPIVFVDRIDLYVMAKAQPELVEELDRVLEVRNALSDDPRAFTDAPDRLKTAKAIAAIALKSTKGSELADDLKKLPRGKGDARNYEKLCLQILKYLFGDDLVGWHEQNRTDDELNRFDVICRAKTDHEFWRFIVEDIGSRYVVFEFKNYSDEIGQGQVLTTEKYLLERGLRRAAFMLTRAGGDEGAQKMAKGAMREHGKLILILDDTSVTEMLMKRDGGTDPTQILFATLDSFLLTLSR